MPITYTHRWDADNAVDYYWVYNSDLNNSHSTLASLTGSGVPYELDAWTGRIAPIVNYTTITSNDTTAQRQRFNVWFDLKSNQSTIVAFAPEGFFADIPVPPVHVIESDVEFFNVSADGSAIIARTIRKDTPSQQSPTISLSNGTNVTLESSSSSTALPASFDLGPWNLTVQDWLPNPDPWNNYSSVFSYHYFILDELIPWYNISGLQNVSGVGTYEAEFAWPPSSSTNTSTAAADGAYLDLSGPLLNTLRIYINDQWTGPVDVTNPIVDIGPFLLTSLSASNSSTNNESAKKQTVRIETPSTLRNRLIQVNVTQSWEQAKYSKTYGGQPYGLVNPVRVVPYREVRIGV